MSRQGVRAEWTEVPSEIRSDVERLAGAPIVSATNIAGGFSPGPAAHCRLADGTAVFVKAAGTALNPYTPDMLRREAVVLGELPAQIPAPTLRGVVDDGDWVALVIGWIDGATPPLPLSKTDIDRTLQMVERLAPVCDGLRLDSLRSCVDTHPDLVGNWQQLLDEPVDGLDTWALDHLAELADLESDIARATTGDSLVHNDFRVDNLVFGGNGPSSDVLVDWPAASFGAAWIDLACLLPSLHLDGGPLPLDVFDAHPVGRAADRAAVDVFVASLAGYFTRNALLPPPPGLPTVRQFQAAQGRVTREWLAQRVGWH